MTHYRQLAREERYLISQLLQMGHSRRAIAARLGRAPSTVSRELSRVDLASALCASESLTL